MVIGEIIHKSKESDMVYNCFNDDQNVSEVCKVNS